MRCTDSESYCMSFQIQKLGEEGPVEYQSHVTHLPACAQTFRIRIRSSANALQLHDASCLLCATAAEERCCQCFHFGLQGTLAK